MGMDFNELLSQVNHLIFQRIQLDKISGEMTVSNPWYGRVLYTIGVQTDTSDLMTYFVTHLKNEAQDLTEKKWTKEIEKEANHIIKTIDKINQIFKHEEDKIFRDEGLDERLGELLHLKKQLQQMQEKIEDTKNPSR